MRQNVKSVLPALVKLLWNQQLAVKFVVLVITNLLIVIAYDMLFSSYGSPPSMHISEFIIIVSMIVLIVPVSYSNPLINLLSLSFPGLFMVLMFFAFDLEINVHNKIPSVKTLKILLTFSDFMGPTAIIIGSVLVIIVILILFISVQSIYYVVIKALITSFDKGTERLHYLFIAFLKLLAIVAIITVPLYGIDEHYERIPWYEKEEVMLNGRFIAFYFHSLNELKADKELESFVYPFNLPPHRILFPDSLSHKPNIYFILLESHLDISRLKNFKFSKFPIHPNLIKFLPDSTFSLTKSPVIGGFTSQPTFEILTGTPALQLFAPVEFSIFGDRYTYSLLTRLKEQGYYTYAFIAASNIYFNMLSAYKDLGFDSAIFMGIISPYKEMFTDQYKKIPDDTLYAFALRQLKHAHSPRFTYLVTMYGHWPWNMPEDSDTILITPEDEQLLLISNVSYKKQKFLGDLIDSLLRTDSNCIIVAFSDHNPPSVLKDTSKVKYNAPSIYHVPILILYKGKKINIPVVPMHRIPELIYYLIAHDTLPDTSNLVSIKTKRLLYKQIIKQSREGL